MPKGSSRDGFTALYDSTGNSASTVQQDICCHAVVEYELVRKCQVAGMKPSKGTPLGKLPELWPFDVIKRQLMAEAYRFVSQIATQGYIPESPVYSFRLWGPYTEKVGTPRDWTPEADNPFIPVGEKRKVTTAWGYQGDELNIEKGCAFLIQGSFLRKASLGRVEEETGVLIV